MGGENRRGSRRNGNGKLEVSTSGLRIDRRFTKAGIHPYDEVCWEQRTAAIANEKGELVFEQKDCEVPAFWSQMATNVVVSKYFRGPLGTPRREVSVRQMISRVVDTITGWGREGGYFATDADAEAFSDELCHLILHQKMSFNSPVWFNLGVPGRTQQASACFIQSVDDSMESILNLAKSEGMLFKGGSGTGSNLSAIRSSQEQLAGGGTASGPVSFMKGFDAFAGVIKSGGTTRRAAKMVILNADHPDVESFITCKVTEERKAWALIDAGYDGAFTGEAYGSVFFQNSNNSVRVTDEFMRAVEEDRDWQLRAVTDPSRILKTVKARALLRLMAESAWQCGDPGIQYDTTINDWHTSSNSGRINASNPCCLVGTTSVETAAGPVAFDVLYRWHQLGRALPPVRSWNVARNRAEMHPIRRVWVAGETRTLVDVDICQGAQIVRCTPEHRFLTAAGDWVQAVDLKPGTEMLLADAAPREQSNLLLAGAATASRTAGQMWPDPHISRATDETRATVTSVRHIELPAPIPVYDMEVEGTHNFVVSGVWPGLSVVAHNSEYMFLDDSACNLASINLLRFLNEDGSFAIDDYRHAVQLTITAQEIVVSPASYPTEKIGKNSEAFRPLGLGYANLGALLMAKGIPYDSPKGRDLAACLTAILTGEGYAQSARIAREVGPFDGYAVNRQPMLRVMAKHREAAYAIPSSTVDADLLAAARATWDEAHELGARHGYRNGQISVIAPTGTISFMLDCDTTGVEPDIALVKYKKLVGGGMLKIVNNTVPAALKQLGYGEGEVANVVAFIDANDTIEGAPKLRDDDLPVFDCAFTPRNGKRSIAWQGHVRMMAAVQPFVSGAISKTVNMPNDSNVEDVEKAYIDGWKMGLKALAIYRDGSKRSQPLATSMDKTTGEKVRIVERPLRRKLPAERQALTHRFEVGGHEGYITVGLYEDGTPGEIFVKMAKEGSTVSGLTDSFAIAVSFALQYGVPLDFLVNKFAHMRFEPQGFTRNPEIPIAKSIVDYIFRWLGSRFLSAEKQTEIGIIRRDAEETETTTAVEGPANAAQVLMSLGLDPISPTSTFQNQADAPSCSECGSLMVRSGSCYKCHNCGATSGCS
jgi:ribonucleotide reductase alpha subunit